MNLKEMMQDVYNQIEDPTKGLPEEIFQFISSVTPMVNVDLLVRDENGHILLAMRDDKFEGMVWHIPGGIIRFRETMEERLQKTAVNELGCRVLFEREPIAVNEIFVPHEERGHFISFLYQCRLPEEFEIHSGEPASEGDLKWFSNCPRDFIKCQRGIYGKYFKGESDG